MPAAPHSPSIAARGILVVAVAMAGAALPAASAAPNAIPAVGSDPATTTTAVPVLPPKAWILVDSDTRRVLSASHEHDLLPPASTTKVLTALAAVRTLTPGTPIPASARAEGQPAMKINMKAGQVWSWSDMLHCLLLPSANDAAMALAEATSGSAEAFQVALDQEATHLGFADAPVLRDPAGLDDHFSVGGGNLLSARDLAIAGRALLADDILAPIVATREYRFTGGDGVFHKIVNHDKLLSLYPGSIGVKTGYTKKAGNTIVAAAQRDGRTLIVVVLGGVGSYSTYGTVTALLDQGFATPAVAEPADADRLPPVPDTPEARLALTEAATTAAAPSTSTGSGLPGLAGEAASQGTATRTDSPAMSGGSGMSVGGLLLGLGLAVVVSLRMRARARMRQRHGRA